MIKHRHLVLIEVMIKILIIFITIHFINGKMEDYIIYDYGKYWYVGFVLLTNILGFVIGQVVARKTIRKEIRREIFTTHYNDCIKMYNTSKARIADKTSAESIEPYALIHAIAIHEFIIGEYGNKNEASIFFRLKDSTLTAMSVNRTELVLTGIDLLLTSLNDTKFDVKPIK